MIRDEVQWVVTDGEKRPRHKWADGQGSHEYDEVSTCADLSVIVPDGWLVVDFDDFLSAQKARDILEGEGIRTLTVKTTRGLHFWFKARPTTPRRNATKARTAVGLVCDRKVGGTNALAVMRQNGIDREVLEDMALEDCPEIPKWLEPVKASDQTFGFLGMGEGDGRNQALFGYILTLQAKGFTRDEVRDTLHIINDYLFAVPLDEDELDTICRDEAFAEPAELVQPEGGEGKGRPRFRHDILADTLISEYDLATLNDHIYIYRDGYFVENDNELESRMIEVYPNIKQNEMNETLKNLRIKTHIKSERVNSDPYRINVRNCIIDVRTGEVSAHSPSTLDFQQLPVVYDPEAKCQDLDGMIDRVFCGDEQLIHLFEEAVGYTLIRNADYQKGFLFFGNGSNGKSCLLRVLQKFLGSANYSTVPLGQLGTHKFAAAELEGKLANIGDDIDAAALRDTGTIKNSITGDAIQVERKGEPLHTIRPFAVQFYSCNTIPRSTDKTAGFYRRFLIIPFLATFRRGGAGYDPRLEQKITTPEAMSRLLNRALEGARRLYENNGFTEPESVTQLVEEYKVDNSNTLSWMADADIDLDYILEVPRDDLYAQFVAWCITSGIKGSNVTGKKTFYKEVRDAFDLSKDARQESGTGKRYFKQR